MGFLTPTNPPRVTLDQRLTPAGQAMLGASLTVDGALEDGFSPGPPEPDRKGKGWDKGKREAPSVRKAVGVNPRSNNREMTLTNHHLPPTHPECRGRKIKIGAIPGQRRLSPFGLHRYHLPKEAALTLQVRL